REARRRRQNQGQGRACQDTITTAAHEDILPKLKWDLVCASIPTQIHRPRPIANVTSIHSLAQRPENDIADEFGRFWRAVTFMQRVPPDSRLGGCHPIATTEVFSIPARGKLRASDRKPATAVFFLP